MNTKVLSGLFLSIVLSSILFTSCKKGDQGLTGPSGSTGAAGSNGANGANGTSGNTILSGEGAPAPTLGVTGDFYLDTKVTALYGPKTSAGWGSPVSLVGAQGADGDAAPTTLVDTFSIYTDDWMMSDDVFVQQSNNNYDTYVAKYYKRWIQDLTNDILDHGMVIVSYTPSKANEPTQWLPIPYTITGYDTHGTHCNYNWSYVTGEHTLRVQFYLTPVADEIYYPSAVPHTAGNAGPDVASFPVPDAQYKVVIIPATVVKEITAVTNKHFTTSGKLLSNF